MDTAKRNLRNVEKLLCPCIDCRNLSRHHDDIILEHLIIKGMDTKYKSSNRWYNHGEQLNVGVEMKLDNTFDLLKSIHYEDEDFLNHTFFSDDKENEDVRKREDDLLKTLEDVETPLYPD